MGEVYSAFIVSSSGTMGLCGEGLRGKDQGSLSTIVLLSKLKNEMVHQILPLYFCKSQNHILSSPLPPHFSFTSSQGTFLSKYKALFIYFCNFQPFL